jgi:hypothetical protein
VAPFILGHRLAVAAKQIQNAPLITFAVRAQRVPDWYAGVRHVSFQTGAIEGINTEEESLWSSLSGFYITTRACRSLPQHSGNLVPIESV